MSNVDQLLINTEKALPLEILEKIAEFKDEYCSVCKNKSNKLEVVHSTKDGYHKYCVKCVSRYHDDMCFFDTNMFRCYVKECNRMCFGPC